jgi:hypothetical protein
MVAPDAMSNMIDGNKPKVGESISVCLNELLICLLVTAGFGQVRRTYMQLSLCQGVDFPKANGD